MDNFDRGRRKWMGKRDAQTATYSNWLHSIFDDDE